MVNWQICITSPQCYATLRKQHQELIITDKLYNVSQLSVHL